MRTGFLDNQLDSAARQEERNAKAFKNNQTVKKALSAKLFQLTASEAEKRTSILATLNQENALIQKRIWMVQDAEKNKAKSATGDWSSMLDSQTSIFDQQDEQSAKNLQDQVDKLTLSTTDFGEAWVRTGDKILDAMSSVGQVLEKANIKELAYADDAIKIQGLRYNNDALYAHDSQQWKANEAKLTKQQIKLEDSRTKSSLQGSLAMLDASVAMFEESSGAQEAAHKLSLVMHAVEMGMELQKQFAAMTTATTVNAANTSTAVTGATASVASAGTGDPYTAPFRVLAMGAMMAGVLSQIGVAFSGASGSSGASYDQITQSDSGVLGGGQSNSIQNLSDKLVEVNADQYSELRAINQNTKFLSEALTSATGALYSTGDISGLSKDLSAALKDGTVSSIMQGFGWGGFASDLANTVFGGGSKTTSQGYGLNVSGQLGGVGTSGYQSMKKKTDGGWFGKSKTSRYDVTSAVSPQVSKAINDTFSYVGSSLEEFGSLLDRNVSGMVDDLRVTTGKIDLTGKTSAEVQESLTNAINVQSDKWAYELFGEVINQYQKLDESAFDTLSRLSIDKAVVEDVLTTTGKSFVGDAIELSQSLIALSGGLSALTDSASSYYDNFFSDAEKFSKLKDTLAESLDWFVSYDDNSAYGFTHPIPETREDYRRRVESINLTTESGRMAYATYLEMAESADKYYSTLEDQQAKYFDTQIDLINTTISAYQGLKDALQGTYDSIVGNGSASSMQYMTAQSVLSGALDGARNGSLPELSSIQDALSVVGQNSTAGYASYQDYQRDQMTTAGMLDELMGYTDAAISVEDSMLSELEKQTALLSGVAIVGAVDGSHATGIARIPFDGYLAETHKDEAIIDARTMQGLRKYGINTSGSSDALIVEVKALRSDVINMQSTLHSGNVAIATNTKKMSKAMEIFDIWDVDGMPGVRV